MLLEILKGTPLPAVDACACCMATGAGAGLQPVNLGFVLPLCATCRARSARLQTFGKIFPFAVTLLPLASAVAAFLAGWGLLAAAGTAVAVFFAATIALGAISRSMFRAGDGHAEGCKPLSLRLPDYAFYGRAGRDRTLLASFTNNDYSLQVLQNGPAAIRASGTWSSIAIIFSANADDAERIFARLFDPQCVGCAVGFSDEASTVGGPSEGWAITVAFQELAAFDWIVKTFSEATDPELAPLPQRFRHHVSDVHISGGSIAVVEPPRRWFFIDENLFFAFPESERSDRDAQRFKQAGRRARVLRSTLDPLTQELLEIGRDVTPEGAAFLSRGKTRTREIGAAFHAEGGMDRMLEAHSVIRSALGATRARELEAAWGGIGQWLS